MNDLGKALLQANKTHSAINSSAQTNISGNNNNLGKTLRRFLFATGTFIVADLILNDGKIIKSFIAPYKGLKEYSAELRLREEEFRQIIKNNQSSK